MKLLNIFYPERVVCLACGRPSHGDFLCPDCQEELDSLRLEAPGAAASYPYRGIAKTLVHRLKFDQTTAAATVLARAIAQDALSLYLPPDTVVTWVTMPSRRKRIRGIDHGQILARAVALRLGFPARQLLNRSNSLALHTQLGLNRLQRLKNLEGAFTAEAPLPRHVLLIDDVYTTGATIQACRTCLRQGGAKVWHLTATTAIKNRR